MTTHLNLVSLTGADDATAIADLNTLGLEFPFVEWALLYVPGKEGEPRNPSQAWREAFFANPPAGSNAVHLCGAQSFDQLLANELPEEILKTRRLQLNINARRPDFSDVEVLRIYEKALTLGPTLILQRHEHSFNAIDSFLSNLKWADRARVTVLLDESRGKGVRPESWSIPWNLKREVIGFAGGLNPDNVAEVATQIGELTGSHWLDMESGVRTDNAFDLAKARAVLVACEPFVFKGVRIPLERHPETGEWVRAPAEPSGRADWAQSLPAWPL